jgi:dTDP-4-amino-4,6-dideoxy-D-galactose acyltransferase
MEQTSLCRYLDWDSDFFGYRIARIPSTHLTLEEMALVTAWCTVNAIDCIYWLVDANNTDVILLAENTGFHLVDIRVTLRQQLSLESTAVTYSAPCTIRPVQPEDVPALKDIAKGSHHDSRFYRDGKFPDSRCDALYQTWIENSCAGYADQVWVAEIDQMPTGYVTCHVLDATHGQIGLFAVAEGMRGRSIGRGLLAESARWLASQGFEDLTVATQGGNDKALRLYERSGFLIRSTHLWYHRWFS